MPEWQVDGCGRICQLDRWLRTFSLIAALISRMFSAARADSDAGSGQQPVLFTIVQAGVLAATCGMKLDHVSLPLVSALKSGTDYWKVNSWGSS